MNEGRQEPITLQADIMVKWEQDDDPDFSYLGEYSDKPSPVHVDREELGDLRRGEYRYFNAGCGDPGPEYIMEDYKRMEAYRDGQWRMMGCVVTARTGNLEAQASLWGIESDADQKYVDEVQAEVTAEAVEELARKIEARLRVE